MAVRQMTESDVPAVLAIEQAARQNPWSERILRDELAASGRRYLVFEEEFIIGFGGVMVVGPDAHITNLLVAPESRQRGVGARLTIGLIESALAMGALNLTLEVRSRNEQARRLYSRFGLAPIGVRQGYYGDDDALIMWAHQIDNADYRARLETLASEYEDPPS